jgi:hypothetical protein
MNTKELSFIIKSAWDAYSATDLVLNPQDNVNNIGLDIDYLFISCIQPTNKTLLLGINRELAIQLAAKMFALPENEVKEEHSIDASSEILNIIAGNTKNKFNEQGSVGIPLHIDPSVFIQHYKHLQAEEVILASSDNKPIYIALFDGDLTTKFVTH